MLKEIIRVLVVGTALGTSCVFASSEDEVVSTEVTTSHCSSSNSAQEFNNNPLDEKWGISSSQAGQSQSNEEFDEATFWANAQRVADQTKEIIPLLDFYNPEALETSVDNCCTRYKELANDTSEEAMKEKDKCIRAIEFVARTMPGETTYSQDYKKEFADDEVIIKANQTLAKIQGKEVPTEEQIINIWSGRSTVK
jgi:hypothetical protein